MEKRQTGLWRKILLWSYPRGSWQYDILCILILLFIFLTPKWFFRGEFIRASGRPGTVEEMLPEQVPPQSDEEIRPRKADHRP